jgi:glycosyltransferase involved in cell wall biosynthesis
LLKKVLKLPYIIIAYDIYPQILEKMNILKSSSIIFKFWKFLNVRVYNNATKIVSIGRDMTKIIIDEMQIKDKSKIHVIHNWSDKETVYPVDKTRNNFIINNQLQNKKILLYSGTLGSTHNVEQILVAADELKQYPQIIFLFIGGGAKVELVKKYISNSNCSNVKYLPFQPIELISQTLSSASLSFVCLDSSFTGLSVPSKSYGILAAGVPIIGLMSSNSEISMMIEENNCGIVWNEEKGTKLSTIILEILKDEIKLEQMKLNAYNTFIKNYEISISVKKYNNLTISALG